MLKTILKTWFMKHIIINIDYNNIIIIVTLFSYYVRFFINYIIPIKKNENEKYGFVIILSYYSDEIKTVFLW